MSAASLPGNASSSTWRVSGARLVSATPDASAASAAIWPGPIALLTMVRVSPRNAGARVSVSAAASMPSRPDTVSTPARVSAASNTASARPDGSSRRPPARMATTGRSRAAARAADRKARRLRMRRMSSRIGPTPGSRASTSRVCAKPTPALPPMPTMVLKPTPFGSAQSSTARHRAADCDTSATRPGRGARWDSVAFRCSAGQAMPNEPGPSTRTPVAACAASTSGARPSTRAAQMLAAASRASTGPIGSPSVAMMATSAAGSVAPSGSTPGKPDWARLAVTWSARRPLADHHHRFRPQQPFGVEAGAAGVAEDRHARRGARSPAGCRRPAGSPPHRSRRRASAPRYPAAARGGRRSGPRAAGRRRRRAGRRGC